MNISKFLFGFLTILVGLFGFIYNMGRLIVEAYRNFVENKWGSYLILPDILPFWSILLASVILSLCLIVIVNGMNILKSYINKP